MGQIHRFPKCRTLYKIIKSYGKGQEAAVYYSMMIQTLGKGPISALQKTWERDLNLTFSDEDWNRICKNVKVFSRDTRVHLIQFKIIHCFYWTPTRLFRLGSLPTSNCWQCRAEEGNLFSFEGIFVSVPVLVMAYRSACVKGVTLSQQKSWEPPVFTC